MNIVLQNKKDIELWLKAYEIIDYTINSDMSVDVNATVHLGNDNAFALSALYEEGEIINQHPMTHIPVRFGRVSGDFNCSHLGLISLEGCPSVVGGSFACKHNRLTSLLGAPQSVGDGFFCDHNQLTTLVGCPAQIEGSFGCAKNFLDSLEFCPTKKIMHFDCSSNRLKSLQHSPRRIGGSFHCGDNKIESLKGCPGLIDRDFDCTDNLLSIIDACPDKIGGHCSFEGNERLGVDQGIRLFEILKKSYKDYATAGREKRLLDKILLPVSQKNKDSFKI